MNNLSHETIFLLTDLGDLLSDLLGDGHSSTNSDVSSNEVDDFWYLSNQGKGGWGDTGNIVVFHGLLLAANVCH